MSGDGAMSNAVVADLAAEARDRQTAMERRCTTQRTELAQKLRELGSAYLDMAQQLDAQEPSSPELIQIRSELSTLEARASQVGTRSRELLRSLQLLQR